jgi:hypothetical protein
MKLAALAELIEALGVHDVVYPERAGDMPDPRPQER